MDLFSMLQSIPTSVQGSHSFLRGMKCLPRVCSSASLLPLEELSLSLANAAMRFRSSIISGNTHGPLASSVQ